jgi:ferredoxin
MPYKDPEKQKAYWKDKYRERREYIDQIKISRGFCEECGWCAEPRILQWHHTDPSIKEFALSKVRAFSEERIDKEIAKCILLCPNCHSLLHFKDARPWQKGKRK